MAVGDKRALDRPDRVDEEIAWGAIEATGFRAEQVAGAMPGGRWNTPGDAADVVAWLTSPAARPLTGQTIDAEGGFRRWRT